MEIVDAEALSWPHPLRLKKEEEREQHIHTMFLASPRLIRMLPAALSQCLLSHFDLIIHYLFIYL